MSQLGSITAEKEKQMALERQRFQEAKAKMLAQQKYKRVARTAGHIALNIVVALIVLLPLLYAVSIAFMPSGELFTLDMNILPKHPTLENFRQALQKVPLVRFVVNSFLVAGLITFGQIISCSLAAFSFSFLDFKGKKCAVYAGDGNYDDSGRGNDYFQLPDSQRMELAGFLSGTDRALSHICNGNLPVQTVLSYISDFAV